MAKKQKHEEHENLERYLVSYADFMTLMFATFVVLYALAQTDVDAFKHLEEALKKAFTQDIFENQASILSGSDSILEGQAGATTPLMLEYMSQKYEQSSYEDIKEDVENMKQNGLSAEMDERGLVIRLNELAIKFDPATANISKDSYKILDEIGDIIKRRFSIHYISIEGHSDSDAISTPQFPSNWELSSARASAVIRYLIEKNDFNPKIFSAVGLADTIPLAKNDTTFNKAKNRRVEIVILKNKHKSLSKKNLQEILNEVKLKQRKNATGIKPPTRAIEGLVGDDRDLLKNVIDMTEQYESENQRIKSLDDEEYLHDGTRPDFMEL